MKERVREAFALFEHKDGSLAAETKEIANIVRSLGYNISEAQASQLLQVGRRCSRTAAVCARCMAPNPAEHAACLYSPRPVLAQLERCICKLRTALEGSGDLDLTSQNGGARPTPTTAAPLPSPLPAAHPPASRRRAGRPRHAGAVRRRGGCVPRRREGGAGARQLPHSAARVEGARPGGRRRPARREAARAPGGAERGRGGGDGGVCGWLEGRQRRRRRRADRLRGVRAHAGNRRQGPVIALQQHSVTGVLLMVARLQLQRGSVLYDAPCGLWVMVGACSHSPLLMVQVGRVMAGAA